MRTILHTMQAQSCTQAKKSKERFAVLRLAAAGFQILKQVFGEAVTILPQAGVSDRFL